MVKPLKPRKKEDPKKAGTVCIACGGTGKATSGKSCYPCRGTGRKRA